MKVKHVNFVEKHLEKVVLALALLVSLAVVGLYVVGQPHAVSVGTRQGLLAPSEIGPALLSDAQILQQSVRAEDSRLGTLAVPAYADDLQNNLYRPVFDRPNLGATVSHPGLDSRVWPSDPPAPRIVELPSPPPVENVRLITDYNVRADVADQALNRAVTDLIGDHYPGDFPYVTVMGQVDLNKWRERLRAAPRDRQILEDWWRGRLAVSDVLLERQTLDPQTNTWGPTDLVPPLPGSSSYRSLHPITDPREGNRQIGIIRDDQKAITQPELWPITGTRPWVNPLAGAALRGPARQQFDQLNREIAELQARLQAAGGGMMRGPGGVERPDPMDIDMGGANGPRGPAGPAGQPLRGLPQSPAAPVQNGRNLPGRPAAPGAPLGGTAEQVVPDLAAIQEEIRLKTRQRDALLAEAHRAPAAPAAAQRDDVFIWAHDMSVKPGMVYRYRLRVAMISPLFQQSALSPEQRRDYFPRLHNIADEANASPWTAAVQIDPGIRFFVVGANQGQRSVTAEVWRIYDGQWRRQEFEVQAGDPIGKVVTLNTAMGPQTVDMRVGALAVDVEFDAPGLKPGENTTRLLYLDPGRNQIAAKSLDRDRDHPARRELRDEAAAAAGVARR